VLLVAIDIALVATLTIAQGQNQQPCLDPVTGGTQNTSKKIMAVGPSANTPIKHVAIIVDENTLFRPLLSNLIAIAAGFRLLAVHLLRHACGTSAYFFHEATNDTTLRAMSLD
jgi:hypothetical protein